MSTNSDRLAETLANLQTPHPQPRHEKLGKKRHPAEVHNPELRAKLQAYLNTRRGQHRLVADEILGKSRTKSRNRARAIRAIANGYAYLLPAIEAKLLRFFGSGNDAEALGNPTRTDSAHPSG